MDRIDDAYNGLMGEEFMRKTRERLHWLCSKVDGINILDIGCSQGTLARILGSLGKNILGIDINKEAIAFAEGKLAEMDASTRERVRFSSVNFMDFKPEELFETVIIGEVLEHLAFPDAFVKKAHGHLVKNGVIVVTVPFGINDDPDHRQTFYWSWINEIIAPYFDIKEVKFFGKWIGVVGVKRDKKVSCDKLVPFDVVKELEKAFYAIERPIVNDNKMRAERMKAQQKTLEETKASLSVAKCEAIKAVESETVQRTRADKAVADYTKMKSWYELIKTESCLLREKISNQEATITHAVSNCERIKNLYEHTYFYYQKLSKSKLGKLTLRYWRIKDGLKAWITKRDRKADTRKESLFIRDKSVKSASCRQQLYQNYNDVVRGVSVVIPTYTTVVWLADAVNSVLAQRSKLCHVQVLICVNGPNEPYYKDLKRIYSGVNDVEVLYTPKVGANAGRNIGIEAAKYEFITFLDSDDMLTSGYFKELIQHFACPDVNIVVGRLVDYDERSGERNTKTGVNGALSKLGLGPVEYLKASPFLASFCMKIYRTKFLRDKLSPLNEGERHTEDVLFWARKFDSITGKIFLSEPSSSEAYIRRVTQNSLSRPTEENRFQFFIVDRLAIIDTLQDILLNVAKSNDHKEFVLSRIKAQTSIMKRFFDDCDVENKQIARQMIYDSQNLFLNKALFSDVDAIAFCHNFSPSVDASAFVATKRLRMIDKIEGKSMKWRVISQNMAKIRPHDKVFKKFYTDFVCAEQIVLNESFGFSPAAQVSFANAAVKAAEKLPVPRLIYSRALFVGSHMAAYQYKKAHPEVKWYAEFSDPLSYGVDDKPRPVQGSPNWNDIEQMVYEMADVIIFTNENQREYMLAYNPSSHLNESIRRRSIIRMHPVIDSRYTKVVSYSYDMDNSKINVGFFGTFYVTRKCNDMLPLLENKKVVLHIFTTDPASFKEISDRYGSQVRVNSTVSQLEFLNLGSRMDYLILTDTDFPGKINPFLPSKYADYLTTGTPILAKVSSNSTLSALENQALLRVSKNFPEIVQSLKKRK